MENKTLPIRWGEYFVRPKLWWIAYCIVCSALVVVTLFSNKRAKWGASTVTTIDLLNALLLASLFIWYVLLTRSKVHEEWEMAITNEWLRIGTRLIKRKDLEWFVLEINQETGTIWNIVLVYAHWHNIYTIRDASQETIQGFAQELIQHTEHLWGFDQSFIEKVGRKLML